MRVVRDALEPAVRDRDPEELVGALDRRRERQPRAIGVRDERAWRRRSSRRCSCRRPASGRARPTGCARRRRWRPSRPRRTARCRCASPRRPGTGGRAPRASARRAARSAGRRADFGPAVTAVIVARQRRPRRTGRSGRPGRRRDGGSPRTRCASRPATRPASAPAVGPSVRLRGLAGRRVDEPQVPDAVVREALAVEHVVEPIDEPVVRLGRRAGLGRSLEAALLAVGLEVGRVRCADDDELACRPATIRRRSRRAAGRSGAAPRRHRPAGGRPGRRPRAGRGAARAGSSSTSGASVREEGERPAVRRPAGVPVVLRADRQLARLATVGRDDPQRVAVAIEAGRDGLDRGDHGAAIGRQAHADRHAQSIEVVGSRGTGHGPSVPRTTIVAPCQTSCPSGSRRTCCRICPICGRWSHACCPSRSTRTSTCSSRGGAASARSPTSGRRCRPATARSGSWTARDGTSPRHSPNWPAWPFGWRRARRSSTGSWSSWTARAGRTRGSWSDGWPASRAIRRRSWRSTCCTWTVARCCTSRS